VLLFGATMLRTPEPVWTPNIAPVASEHVATIVPPKLEPIGLTIERPWDHGEHGLLKLYGEIEFMRLARDGRTLAIGLSHGAEHH
jgi:hypothetical protein